MVRKIVAPQEDAWRKNEGRCDNLPAYLCPPRNGTRFPFH